MTSTHLHVHKGDFNARKNKATMHFEGAGRGNIAYPLRSTSSDFVYKIVQLAWVRIFIHPAVRKKKFHYAL